MYSPSISVSTRFDDNCVITLVKFTIFDQKILRHLQVYPIIIMTMCENIQPTNHTFFATKEMNRPKRSFFDLEILEQHMLTLIEMNKMRAKMARTYRHLALLNRIIE